MIRSNRPSIFNATMSGGGPAQASVFSGMGSPSTGSGIVGGNEPMPSFGPGMVIQGMSNPVMNAQPAPTAPGTAPMPSVFAAQPQDIPMSDAAMKTGFLGAQPMSPVSKPSFFDKIGDFVSSPAGVQALLASAGATMQGGLGAGITAGLGAYNQYGQQQAQMDAQNRRLDQGDRGLEIDQQRADVDAIGTDAKIQNLAVQAGIDVAKLQEVIRKNKTRETLDEEELRIDAFFKQAGVDLRYLEERGRNARTGATIEAANYRHETPSASTLVAQEGANYRNDYKPQATTVEVPYGEKGKARSTAFSGPGGEVRYDAQGNGYRKDPITGRVVRAN